MHVVERSQVIILMHAWYICINSTGSYGVRRNIHTWIASFLTNRTQSVVVNNATSSSVPVTSGIPQGTVLGPVLFLINDLQDNV